MKIEMLESAAYSWLRHTKKCQIVQQNWKPSPLWESFFCKKPGFFNAIKTASVLLARDGIQLIKTVPVGQMVKQTDVDQWIKQAEIDVLGLAIGHDSSRLYAVECAFHGSGLNYGSNTVTRNRIVKKLFRSVAAAKLFFPKAESHFFFLSPRIYPAVRILLEEGIKKLEIVSKEVGWDVRYSLVANEEFSNEIMRDLHDCSREVADTSELFLRSLQLSNLSKQIPTIESIAIPEIDSDESRGNRRNPVAAPREATVDELREKLTRWGHRENSIVFKTIQLVLNAKNGRIERGNLVAQVEEQTGTDNAYQIVASLLTDKGNAYGKVLNNEDGIISIRDDLRTFVEENWPKIEKAEEASCSTTIDKKIPYGN